MLSCTGSRYFIRDNVLHLCFSKFSSIIRVSLLPIFLSLFEAEQNRSKGEATETIDLEAGGGGGG